jgi:hypothetical protein
MKRTLVTLSLVLVLAAAAFGQMSQLKAACSGNCCSGDCSTCCPDGCGSCCQGK